MNAPWWVTLLVATIAASGTWGTVVLRAVWQRHKTEDARETRTQAATDTLIDKALEIANVAFAHVKDMEAEAATTAAAQTQQIGELMDRIKILEDQVRVYKDEIEHLKADLYDCLRRQGRQRPAASAP